MIQIKSFVFGPFQENTYVLWDETLEAVVIDPGNSSTSEHLQLKNFITQNNLDNFFPSNPTKTGTCIQVGGDTASAA